MPEDKTRDSAFSIHQQLKVVDAHCDTLLALIKQRRRLGEMSPLGHLDLPRLKKGGVSLQFFAAFVAPEYRWQALVRVMEIIDLFYLEYQENAEGLKLVRNYADFEGALHDGRTAVLLSVEGGEALMGRLEVLRMLHRLGVRSLTLTWNHRNELADGVDEGKTGGGLTLFGRSVVLEMNRLGMLVDVSHLSERGFYDTLELSSRPVIASHSNCKTLCDHPRNLDDRQIKVLAERGGVLGLCFYPKFISNNEASLEKFLDHVDHVADLAGCHCIGLGSDFDGIDEVAPGLDDATCYPRITEGLVRRGYGPEEIRGIMGENFIRIIRDVLG